MPNTKVCGFKHFNMEKIKGFWKFAVFCFVGGTSAIIHLGVFNVLFKVFKVYFNLDFLIFGASFNYILAYLMGMFISIIYNFSMNRNITFSAKHEPVKMQLPRYIVVYTCSIAIGFIVSLIAVNLIGESTLNANIATFCGILASIPISFLGSLLWTFRPQKLIQ